MDVLNIVLITVLSVVAGSYAWAMRGTILGGERGAMLPGAVLGLIFAFASGSEVVRENFWILAAVGACGMFFGGAQTYGQTLEMTHDKENKKRRLTGRTGVFVKGATWFGIFGGMIGLCMAAMAGKYTVKELCIFAVAIPAAQGLGTLCLNSPQKPKKGKFPPIYFSEGRHESWGSFVFVWLEIVIFAVIKKDIFTLVMAGVGLISGGFGFLIGNFFQTGSAGPLKNGKYLFGKLQKNGFVGSWKTMEFTLGAVGALGTSLCFCLLLPATSYASIIDKNGIWNPLETIGKGNLDVKLALGWAILFIIYVALCIIPEQKPYIPEITAKCKSGEISEARFNELMERATNKKQSKVIFALKGLSEGLIWPVYCYFPLLLAFLGSELSAQMTAFFVIFWVLAEKVGFEKGFEKRIRPLKAVRAVLFIIGGAMFVLQITGFYKITALHTWLLYCLSYEVVECILTFAPSKIKELKEEHGSTGKALLSFKSALTGRVFSLFEIAVMIVMGCFLFL